MALLGPYFIDSSILLGGLIRMQPGSVPADKVLDLIATGRLRPAQTAWHCCLEFYSVSTRLPEELRLSREDALRLVEEEILGRFEVHGLPRKSYADFFPRAVADRVAGGKIYDFHIASVALAAGAKVLVTENRQHFTSILRHGVSVLSARELLEELK